MCPHQSQQRSSWIFSLIPHIQCCDSLGPIVSFTGFYKASLVFGILKRNIILEDSWYKDTKLGTKRRRDFYSSPCLSSLRKEKRAAGTAVSELVPSPRVCGHLHCTRLEAGCLPEWGRVFFLGVQMGEDRYLLRENHGVRNATTVPGRQAGVQPLGEGTLWEAEKRTASVGMCWHGTLSQERVIPGESTRWDSQGLWEGRKGYHRPEKHLLFIESPVCLAGHIPER